MFNVLRTNELTEDQKNWLAVAICGAIIADGNIAPEEIQYLERALSFLSSQTKVDSLIEAVKSQSLPAVEECPNATRAQEAQMLMELAMVVSSDNSLSTREMDYLFHIGRKLGFGQEYVRIIIRWASEKIVWHRKMLQLIQAGTELPRDEN